MEEQIVVKLIELVETASPILWGIARRQALVVLVQSLLAATIFGIAGIRLYLLMQRLWKESEEMDQDQVPAVFVAFLAFMVFVLAGVAARAAIEAAINPDYVAIRALIDLVRAPIG